LQHTKFRIARLSAMAKNNKTMPSRQANITEIWSRKRQKDDPMSCPSNAKKRRVIESDDDEAVPGVLIGLIQRHGE
jgi:hypothetical protein